MIKVIRHELLPLLACEKELDTPSRFVRAQSPVVIGVSRCSTWSDCTPFLTGFSTSTPKLFGIGDREPGNVAYHRLILVVLPIR